MVQEAVEGVPQRGTLLRRAHELLESLGRPTAEDLLIQHLFGANEDTQNVTTGRNAVWTLLLRQVLNSSSLFEQTSEREWSLSSWRSTHMPLENVEFVVLDTETTGLRPGPDRVIEVAGIRLRNGEVIDSFQSLVNPNRRLPPFIVQFTGITQEMVSAAPGAAQVFPDFFNFIEGAILVGHNVGFDIGCLFLNPAWKRDFPAKPGVYLMKDENGQIIYVGKAKCLKDRLASYYSQPLGYTRKMDGLLQNVHEIETRVLGSELEALLVESQLIKQLQPTYNVQLRNYELYPFIKIDVQHPFPRVYSTKEVAADGARYFGPFRSRRIVDFTIELIQKVFPVRTCIRSLPPLAKPSDPCLRLHLDRCPGPCRGNVDPAEYAKVIEQICAFLGGEREDLLDRLRRQMLEASQQMNYERAAWLRDTIRSADEVLIGQRLITGAVEANNLFIVYPSAREDHNELFLVRHGRLVQQKCIPHEPQEMKEAVLELLDVAAALGDAPSIVGKAEVDQINIISRWIHHHSDDRAFFPLQPALTDPHERRFLTQRIWVEIDAARAQPSILLVEDQEEDPY